MRPVVGNTNFQNFLKEQKSILTSKYPFLTQHQIRRKAEEIWRKTQDRNTSGIRSSTPRTNTFIKCKKKKQPKTPTSVKRLHFIVTPRRKKQTPIDPVQDDMDNDVSFKGSQELKTYKVNWELPAPTPPDKYRRSRHSLTTASNPAVSRLKSAYDYECSSPPGELDSMIRGDGDFNRSNPGIYDTPPKKEVPTPQFNSPDEWIAEHASTHPAYCVTAEDIDQIIEEEYKKKKKAIKKQIPDSQDVAMEEGSDDSDVEKDALLAGLREEGVNTRKKKTPAKKILAKEVQPKKTVAKDVLSKKPSEKKVVSNMSKQLAEPCKMLEMENPHFKISAEDVPPKKLDVNQPFHNKKTTKEGLYDDMPDEEYTQNQITASIKPHKKIVIEETPTKKKESSQLKAALKKDPPKMTLTEEMLEKETPPKKKSGKKVKVSRNVRTAQVKHVIDNSQSLTDMFSDVNDIPNAEVKPEKMPSIIDSDEIANTEPHVHAIIDLKTGRQVNVEPGRIHTISCTNKQTIKETRPKKTSSSNSRTSKSAIEQTEAVYDFNGLSPNEADPSNTSTGLSKSATKLHKKREVELRTRKSEPFTIKQMEKSVKDFDKKASMESKIRKIRQAKHTKGFDFVFDFNDGNESVKSLPKSSSKKTPKPIYNDSNYFEEDSMCVAYLHRDDLQSNSSQDSANSRQERINSRNLQQNIHEYVPSPLAADQSKKFSSRKRSVEKFPEKNSEEKYDTVADINAENRRILTRSFKQDYTTNNSTTKGKKTGKGKKNPKNIESNPTNQVTSEQQKSITNTEEKDEPLFKTPRIPSLKFVEGCSGKPTPRGQRGVKKINETTKKTKSTKDLITPQMSESLIEATMKQAAKVPRKQRKSEGAEAEKRQTRNGNAKARKSLDGGVLSPFKILAKEGASEIVQQTAKILSQPKTQDVSLSPYERRKAGSNRSTPQEKSPRSTPQRKSPRVLLNKIADSNVNMQKKLPKEKPNAGMSNKENTDIIQKKGPQKNKNEITSEASQKKSNRRSPRVNKKTESAFSLDAILKSLNVNNINTSPVAEAETEEISQTSTEEINQASSSSSYDDKSSQESRESLMINTQKSEAPSPSVFSQADTLDDLCQPSTSFWRPTFVAAAATRFRLATLNQGLHDDVSSTISSPELTQKPPEQYHSSAFEEALAMLRSAVPLEEVVSPVDFEDEKGENFFNSPTPKTSPALSGICKLSTTPSMTDVVQKLKYLNEKENKTETPVSAKKATSKSAQSSAKKKQNSAKKTQSSAKKNKTKRSKKRVRISEETKIKQISQETTSDRGDDQSETQQENAPNLTEGQVKQYMKVLQHNVERSLCDLFSPPTPAAEKTRRRSIQSGPSCSQDLSQAQSQDRQEIFL